MEKIDEDFHLHGELPHQLNADEPNEKDTHEVGDNESVIEFFDTLPALRPNNYVPFTHQVKMIKRKHGITDNNITPHQPCNTLSPIIGNNKITSEIGCDLSNTLNEDAPVPTVIIPPKPNRKDLETQYGRRIGLSEMSWILTEWSTKYCPRKESFDTIEEALSPRLKLPVLKVTDPILRHLESDYSYSSDENVEVKRVTKLRKLYSSDESSSEDHTIVKTKMF